MTNLFNISNCVVRGCNKVLGYNFSYGNHTITIKRCGAYEKPSKLSWHRQGKECPLGPYTNQSSEQIKVRIGQQKQKKRGR
jgi:hypothetical protein